jgi:hypothetical protein
MKFCYFEYKKEKNWGLLKDNLVFPIKGAETFSPQTKYRLLSI